MAASASNNNSNSGANSGNVWKYAVRLDDPSSAVALARMLDHWGHGPVGLGARLLAAVSRTTTGSNSPAGAATLSPADAGRFISGPNMGGSSASSSNNSNNNNANYSTASASVFRTPVASQYVVFTCAEGQRFVVSYSLARMCDSLAAIMDDLDLDGASDSLLAGSAGGGDSPGASPSQAQKATSFSNDPVQMVDAVVGECAVLEIALGAQTLEAVLVYLALCLENGAASVPPYPLPPTAPLSSLISGWEDKFLSTYAPHLTVGSGAAAGAPAPATTSANDAELTNLAALNGGDRSVPFAPPTFTAPLPTIGAAAATAAGTSYAAPVCPPLLSLLRAADYLGIHTLRDLTAAALASGLLRTRDETALAAMLGLPRLPTENELQDVYQRFPFLNPGRELSGSASVAAVGGAGGAATAASGGAGRAGGAGGPAR